MEKKLKPDNKALKPTLADQPFLRGMKQPYIELLARHATIVDFEAGQTIFHQNEFADHFFILLEGKVCVETDVPRSENIPVQILGVGDVLGWSWLFAPFTWHFQARALEATRAICLNAASLLVASENDYGFGFDLMERVVQVVIARLKTSQQQLLALYKPDVFLRPLDETPFRRPDLPLKTGNIQEMLAEHPFSKGMKLAHLKTLADAAMTKEFEAGESIFRDDDLANRFYLIEHGKIIIEFPDREGDPVPIEILGDGDMVGWSWLFPPYYSHFDARALERTSAIFVFGTKIREESYRDHDFGYELMKRVCRVLIERLQATRKQVLALHHQHSRLEAPARCE